MIQFIFSIQRKNWAQQYGKNLLINGLNVPDSIFCNNMCDLIWWKIAVNTIKKVFRTANQSQLKKKKELFIIQTESDQIFKHSFKVAITIILFTFLYLTTNAMIV